MTDLVAIAYKSKAVRDLTAPELDRLLLDARQFNLHAGVSGVLFYHDAAFFQYFEGPSRGVSDVYDRIRKSTTHGDLLELANLRVPERQFDAWHMGFCEPPASALQILANSSWEESIPITRTQYARSEGLGLLLYYWNKWKAESYAPIALNPRPLPAS